MYNFLKNFWEEDFFQCFSIFADVYYSQIYPF